MFPKALVRIIHEMIPLEQVDEIAQVINFIMFTPSKLKFNHWRDPVWVPGDAAGVGVVRRIQMRIATLGGESGFDFGVFVDKPTLYFKNDRRTIIAISTGVNENITMVNTHENAKMPLREHIYSIANELSIAIEVFKNEFCGDNRSVEFLCKRRPLDEITTLDELCEIFC